MTERYCVKLKKYIEDSKVDSFLNEIVDVCKKHGLSISHEDGHGAFMVVPLSPHCVEWIKQSLIGE